MAGSPVRSIRRSLTAAAALGRVFLLRRRVPLFVSWNVTFRCNLHCKYCGACDAPKTEMDSAGVCRGLDDLWALGARWITFGGGEPLLREDIGTLVDHAKTLGFEVFLSTNGWFVKRRAGVVRRVDHVNLSLDGGRGAHDEVRGPGAFDKTVEGAAYCLSQGVPVSLQCTLSALNLDSVDEVLAVAKSLGVWVMFHPATAWLDSSRKPNPIAPAPEAYRQALDRVAEAKRAGAPVANSLEGLKHLRHWPDTTPIWCGAGRIMAVVEPDGRLFACHQCEFDGAPPEGAEVPSLREQFTALTPLKGCGQCWCGPVVDLAMIFSMKPRALSAAVRRIFE